MGALNSAVAAMDAHRDTAAVVEWGLRFLCNLSFADRNKVCVVHEYVQWTLAGRTVSGGIP